ncbi:MAG: flavin reductase family protein [Burkholderiaceae bacterium]
MTANNAQPVNEASFRQAMGCFTTGVTVVTTLNAQGEPIGLTVNSFNSVSMAPPMVLWSLAGESPNLQAFSQHPAFAVNILTVDQVDLCHRFASQAEDRFKGVRWSAGLHGVPVLANTAASFECINTRQIPGGDHEIFLGEVTHVSSSSALPLLYSQGRFGQMESEASRNTRLP